MLIYVAKEGVLQVAFVKTHLGYDHTNPSLLQRFLGSSQHIHVVSFCVGFEDIHRRQSIRLHELINGFNLYILILCLVGDPGLVVGEGVPLAVGFNRNDSA